MGLKALIKSRFRSRRTEVNPYLASTPQRLAYPYARPKSPVNAVGSDHESLYEPLELSRRQIRLLKVEQLDLDGQGRPILYCSLVVVSFDQNPEYDVLSYTWGDADDLENIHINSRVLLIRRNLFNALCTLRNSGVLQGYIWADAVCINQEDVYERNQQVELMTDIYTDAQTVRIWLGLDMPGVERFFVKTANGPIFDALISNSSHDDGSLDGFRHVISRQWWRRLWIVQEAVLARRAIVHCGNKTVPWTRLRSSIDEISKAMASMDYAMEQLEIIGLQHLVQCNDSIGGFEPWKDLIRGPSQFGQPIILMSCLSKCDMSDDRDLVYGALGILPEYLTVRVDYNLSLPAVYQIFAERIMERTGSLQLLSECQYPAQDKLWPSWVPDFRQFETFLLEPRYNPSLDAPYRVPKRQGNDIVVQAHIFDEVSIKGRPSLTSASFYSPEKISDMAFLRTILKDWLNLTTPSNKDGNSMDGNKQFWNTICQAILPTAVGLDTSRVAGSGESIASELQCWLDSTKTELTAPAEKHLLSKNLYNSTFCVSKSGRRMLCRIEPNIGDHIAILPTCKMPLLLRPCSGRLPNSFQIVSCCFCEGVMYGEYIRTAAKTPINKYPCHTDGPTNRLLESVLRLHTAPNSFVDVPDLDYCELVLAQIAMDIETELQSVNGTASTLLTQLFEKICTEGHPTSAALMVKGLVIDEPDVARARTLVIFVACAFEILMSRFEKTQRPEICGDEQLREATEALVLCISIYVFEIILCVERTKSNYDGPVITEHFTKMQQLVEDGFGFPAEGGASKKWYAALKHAAMEEFEIEKGSTLLYQEIVLV